MAKSKFANNDASLLCPHSFVYEDAVQVDSTDWSWRAGGAEDDGEVHLKLRLLVLFVKRSGRLRMMSSLPRCSTHMSRN